MTAAGESDQRDEDKGADEIPTNSTRHARQNASNFVKDCSMMLRRRRVRRVLTMPLDPAPPFRPHRGRAKGGVMEGKAKYIFPIIATATIIFIVSAVVTFSNIGFRADFVRRWLTAFIIGWPVGATPGVLGFPLLRRVAVGIAGLIERG